MTAPQQANRLLFWSDLFWPYIGGVEILGMHLTDALRRKGWEILVISSHDSLPLPDDEDYDGIKVRRFHLRQALLRGDVDRITQIRRAMADQIHTFNPEVVHFNTAGPTTVCFPWTCLQGQTPSVASVTTDSAGGSGETDTVLAGLLENVDWTIFHSRALAAQMGRRFSGLRSRSCVIHPSLRPPVRQAEVPVEAAPTLLAVGRLVHEKGFDVALRAFPPLLSRFPRLRLKIAGDGPESSALQRLSVELGVADSIDFVGPLAPSLVPKAMQESCLVLMPSRVEPFGLVALQAAQVGRPVVVARVGGLTEIVADGCTGLWVPPDDPNALERAVRGLLEDPARRRRMGREALQRARSRFDFDRFVEEHEALYRQLMPRETSPAPQGPEVGAH